MLFLNHVTQAHISKLIFFKKNLYLTDLIPEVQRWLKNLSKHHQQIKWKKKKKTLNCMIILRHTQNVYLAKFQSYF